MGRHGGQREEVRVVEGRLAALLGGGGRWQVWEDRGAGMRGEGGGQ